MVKLAVSKRIGSLLTYKLRVLQNMLAVGLPCAALSESLIHISDILIVDDCGNTRRQAPSFATTSYRLCVIHPPYLLHCETNLRRILLPRSQQFFGWNIESMSTSSSTDDDFLLCAHMNQVGLEAMEQGRTEDALLILRLTVGFWMIQNRLLAQKEAIQRIKTVSSESQSHHEYFRNQQYTTINSCPMTFNMHQAMQRHSQVYDKLPIPLYTKAFFIYPFEMPRNIATALLCYNCGLCCHMHSLTQCRSGSALQDALHFYRNAYQMVTRECATISEKGKPWNDAKYSMVPKYVRLLMAAVCHNMALLYQIAYGNMLAANSLRNQLQRWIHEDDQSADGAFFHVGISLARFNSIRFAPAA